MTVDFMMIWYDACISQKIQHFIAFTDPRPDIGLTSTRMSSPTSTRQFHSTVIMAAPKRTPNLCLSTSSVLI